jgi:hypothetical protein
MRLIGHARSVPATPQCLQPCEPSRRRDCARDTTTRHEAGCSAEQLVSALVAQVTAREAGAFWISGAFATLIASVRHDESVSTQRRPNKVGSADAMGRSQAHDPAFWYAQGVSLNPPESGAGRSCFSDCFPYLAGDRPCAGSRG